jgi:hypothetical protein
MDSALKMETARFSDMLVSANEFTHHRHLHRRENLRSHTTASVCAGIVYSSGIQPGVREDILGGT